MLSLRLGSPLNTADTADEKTAKGILMTKSDTKALLAFGDVPAAFGLLTRLPIRVDFDAATARGAAAAWVYPLVGLVIGALAAFTGVIAMTIGLPAAIAAVFVILVQTVLTGAMHEDGLADCADGFWGGWTAEHRLKIMKDSHIGAYGVVALILGLLLRWLAISTVLDMSGGVAILIAAAMVSRAAMVSLMTMMPNARDNGLSQSVGRPSRNTAYVSTVLALIGCLVLVGPLTIPMILATMLTGLCFGLLAWVKIKGQTGDVLGATQQLTEIFALLSMVALAS